MNPTERLNHPRARRPRCSRGDGNARISSFQFVAAGRAPKLVGGIRLRLKRLEAAAALRSSRTLIPTRPDAVESPRNYLDSPPLLPLCQDGPEKMRPVQDVSTGRRYR